MTWLNLIGVTDAMAQAPAAHASTESSLLSVLPMLIVFIFIFYFLLIRPQSKRMKTHQKMIAEIGKGDEVITNGGIVGKVTKITDDFIKISIAENVEITIQKAAISQTLPKGTLKSV